MRSEGVRVGTDICHLTKLTAAAHVNHHFLLSDGGGGGGGGIVLGVVMRVAMLGIRVMRMRMRLVMGRAVTTPPHAFGSGFRFRCDHRCIAFGVVSWVGATDVSHGDHRLGRSCSDHYRL